MLQIKRFVFNPFQENCYVVSDDTREAVIIDCGAFYKEEREAIIDYIRDYNLTPIHLLNTHAHIDHNFGNNTISDKFGILPELHVKDAYLYETLKEQAISFANITLDYDIPPIGRLLADNNVITFGEHKLKIIPTSGHTPGSVFYYCEEESIAFSGDTLFRMSIGRTDFELGSYKDIVNSLKTISQCLPQDTSILPGHGPETTMKMELKDNPYLKM